MSIASASVSTCKRDLTSASSIDVSNVRGTALHRPASCGSRSRTTSGSNGTPAAYGARTVAARPPMAPSTRASSTTTKSSPRRSERAFTLASLAAISSTIARYFTARSRKGLPCGATISSAGRVACCICSFGAA